MAIEVRETAPRDQSLVNNGKDEHASLSEAVVNSNGDKKNCRMMHFGR